MYVNNRLKHLIFWKGGVVDRIRRLRVKWEACFCGKVNFGDLAMLGFRCFVVTK
jgi:hypothetical protein